MAILVVALLLLLAFGLSCYVLTGFIAWLVDRARGVSRP